MLEVALAALLTRDDPFLSTGDEVGLGVTRREVGGHSEYVEELYVKDKSGKFRLILVSPTHPTLGDRNAGSQFSNALQGPGQGGLFSSAPSFGFSDVKVHEETASHVVVLTAKGSGYELTKTIWVPLKGRTIRETIEVHFTAQNPAIRYLLNTYAFAPDGKRMSKGGKPDATFAPAIRPTNQNVIADHFFRSPAVVVQKGSLAASLMPDLDVLRDNRPMPTIVDLDCASGVADAPLMSYGFCDSRLVGHVYFANDASMIRPVPHDLKLGFDILLDADAEPMGAYRESVATMWDRYGSKYFDKVLPQAMPFAGYAELCYPAAFNEHYGDNKLGWFETDIDGHPCGGVMAGWGYDAGWVSWQDWFNNLRSAWGMRWWGKKLNHPDWSDKADKMLNLALAAPMKDGACPTSYNGKTHEWGGSLIKPTSDCYYDLTNEAWKGIWMLKFLEFSDCPRRDEILSQCRAMADLMVAKQGSDGAIPTWLDKDLKIVPVLDRSAQTALPGWFMAELCKQSEGDRSRYLPAVRKASDFLVANVVDQQRWYDYETFFSCSPKECHQRDGNVDDPSMHDPHTLQPPQNTMSMQWAAEVLKATSDLTGEKKYMPYALKALDTMCLYQVVWPISYRRVAYTYGSFGVQNSDGEYNDARQAQFGATLCDFGEALGRKDYFERGVAATRAALALINCPRHIELGIYPNPNYPLGLEPENNGHGGTDQQDGRTGFDWGEGSGLTSMAYLLDKYGSSHSVAGQTVAVDGDTSHLEPAWGVPQVLTDPDFDMKDWRMPGWTFDGDFLRWAVRNPRSYDWNDGGYPFIGTCEDGRGGYDDTYTGTITSPQFKLTKSKLHLKVGGGAGQGEYVELIDSTGKQLFVAHGHNNEHMDDLTWDVSPYLGQVLQIRIVDKEKEGWGHINVGRIYAE